MGGNDPGFGRTAPPKTRSGRSARPPGVVPAHAFQSARRTEHKEEDDEIPTSQSNRNPSENASTSSSNAALLEKLDRVLPGTWKATATT